MYSHSFIRSFYGSLPLDGFISPSQLSLPAILSKVKNLEQAFFFRSGAPIVHAELPASKITNVFTLIETREKKKPTLDQKLQILITHPSFFFKINEMPVEK